jgi:hypothetical protein
MEGLNQKDFTKITRKQPEEATVLRGSGGELLVPGANKERIDSETPQTARNWVQFKKKSEAITDRRRNPLDTIWKQEYRPPIADEANGSKEELTKCICYQFDPRCWAASGKLWTKHLKEYRRSNGH